METSTMATSILEIDSSPESFKCDANGSLLSPIQVGPMNQTLTRAEQIHPLGECFYLSKCYYINCTTWNGPPELAKPIYGYIMPIILAITFIANILIIMVLSKKHMRSPTNLVLTAMAISDLLTVVFPAPWYFYIYTLGYDDAIQSRDAGYAFEAMLESIPQIFHTASIWLTLALAMQRYIYVCHADTARVWCTISKTKKAIAWIFFTSTMHQMTRFFDRIFEITRIEYPICSGNFINICKVTFASWVVEDISLDIYFVTFWWFRVLFVHLIPCASLVVLNFLLFRAMREADKKRERLLNCRQKATTGSSKRESKETRKIQDSNTTTLMLIIVITIFLTVELPLGIITILHTISSTIHDFLDYSAVKSIVLAVNLCMCLSYPLNFAIYCGMSRQFRETFQDLFLKKPMGGQGNGNGFMRTNSQSRKQTGQQTFSRGQLLSHYTIVNGNKSDKNDAEIVAVIVSQPNLNGDQCPETNL